MYLSVIQTLYGHLLDKLSLITDSTVASSNSVTRRVFTEVNEVISHEVWAVWVME